MPARYVWAERRQPTRAKLRHAGPQQAYPRETSQDRREDFYYCAYWKFLIYLLNISGCNGAWLSLVERSVRDAEVTGSSPVAPTIKTLLMGFIMKKQLHLYYSGRVQGIGFRYTVQDIAASLKICGWVKNLIDGRVEVLAQAEEDILGGFL